MHPENPKIDTFTHASALNLSVYYHLFKTIFQHANCNSTTTQSERKLWFRERSVVVPRVATGASTRNRIARNIAKPVQNFSQRLVSTKKNNRKTNAPRHVCTQVGENLADARINALDFKKKPFYWLTRYFWPILHIMIGEMFIIDILIGWSIFTAWLRTQFFLKIYCSG